jgi:hypothetical protein
VGRGEGDGTFAEAVDDLAGVEGALRLEPGAVGLHREEIAVGLHTRESERKLVVRR